MYKKFKKKPTKLNLTASILRICVVVIKGVAIANACKGSEERKAHV